MCTVENEELWYKEFAFQARKEDRKAEPKEGKKAKSKEESKENSDQFKSWVYSMTHPRDTKDLQDMNRFPDPDDAQNYFEWKFSAGDVIAVSTCVPPLPYTLAIMDPPYGILCKDDDNGPEWDKEPFSPNQLGMVLAALPIANSNYLAQKDWYMTVIVFCSSQQLSPFIGMVEDMGYHHDEMVWTKPQGVTEKSEFFFWGQ